MKKILNEQINAESMCFVLDFDGTITQKIVHGEFVPSLISILYTQRLLDDDYSQRATALRDIYYPKEVDVILTPAQKFPYMEEWWEKHSNLLIEKRVSLDKLRLAADHPLLAPRPGMRELFTLAAEKHIPIIIFSTSGVGEIPIRFFLEKHNLLNKYVHIVSNRYKVNERGEFTERILPFIHGLNKDESVLSFFPEIQTKITSAQYILLFGDSLHDVHMAEDQNHNEVYRIGFLSEVDEEKQKLQLPSFEKMYDRVLLGEVGILDIIRQLKNTCI